MNHDNISFDLPKNKSNVIKVIGVGGGGSNAVNYMFNQGIADVDFVICNTDAQALNNSNIPNKIQLGVTLTEGLGAGANPDIGNKSAKESVEELKNMLSSNTKMIFLTAGMGGGTGTGAAPVIAKLASEMGILTVGIVTVPFEFEGKKRLEQAQEGVEELRKYVDSLIVINNNKLREIYGNLGYKSGFAKADEILATAAKSITNVITKHYGLNIDLHDAKTVLSNSGTAIMGSAEAAGENRARAAVEKALDSPLLNDNKITGAKNVLLLIVSGDEEITLDEMGEINDYINAESGGTANVIFGIGDNPDLGERVSITVIATGFPGHQQDGILDKEPVKTIHTLDDSNKADEQVQAKASLPAQQKDEVKAPEAATLADKPAGRVVHVLEEDKEEVFEEKVQIAEPVAAPVEVNAEEISLEEKEELINNDIAAENSASGLFAEQEVKEEVVAENNIVAVEETEAEETLMFGEITDELISENVSEPQIEEEELLFDNPFSAEGQTTIEFDIIDNNIEEDTPVFAKESENVTEEEFVDDLMFEEEEAEEPKRIIHTLEDFEEKIIADLSYVNSPMADTDDDIAETKQPEAEIISFVEETPVKKEPVESTPVISDTVETVMPQTFSDGSKRFALKEYNDLEEKINSAKPAQVEAVQEEEEPEMQITLKTRVSEDVKRENNSNGFSNSPFGDGTEYDIDPTDVPLSKKDQIGIDRRQRLRRFNHRFKASTSANIDEIEKQPAYKRAGIDVSSSPQSSASRYSLGNNNDDVVLKSNNSFLHDNVD